MYHRFGYKRVIFIGRFLLANCRRFWFAIIMPLGGGFHPIVTNGLHSYWRSEGVQTTYQECAYTTTSSSSRVGTMLGSGRIERDELGYDW